MQKDRSSLNVLLEKGRCQIKMEVTEIEPLHNLNKISTIAKQHCGISYNRIYKEDTNVVFLSDCLQKIAFSIQDLNHALQSISSNSFQRRDIIYIILLVTWIQEAFDCIQKSLKPCLNTTPDNNEDLQKARKFINATRSFIVAHPLTTNRHSGFGFDGNYICIDISRIPWNHIPPYWKHSSCYCLSFDGLKETPNKVIGDFALTVYSEKDDGMQFYHHIGCSFKDFYKVAELYIDRLYQLDTFIRKAARDHLI